MAPSETVYGAIPVVDPESSQSKPQGHEAGKLEEQVDLDLDTTSSEEREARRRRWLTLTLVSISALAAFIVLCVGAANSYLVHPVVVPELTDDFTEAVVEGHELTTEFDEDDDEDDEDDGDDTAVSQYKYDDDPYVFNDEDDVDDWPAPTPSRSPTRAPNHEPPGSASEPAYEPEPATSYAGFGKAAGVVDGDGLR